MTILSNKSKTVDKQSSNHESLIDSVKILSNITQKDIEKSYNLDTIRGTEAYYSNRYGWTLRKTI